MTRLVQVLQVSLVVRPSLCHRYYVVGFNFLSIEEMVVTDRAFPVLNNGD